jgi:hypothetical protein
MRFSLVLINAAVFSDIIRDMTKAVDTVRKQEHRTFLAMVATRR